MCVICEIRFYDLRRHMYIHGDKDKFKCNIYEDSFSQLSILKSHTVTHSEKRPFSCNKCEQSFKVKSHLKNHISLKHSVQSPSFKCDQCGKTFKTLSSLQSHSSLKHSADNPFKCKICDKVLTRPGLKYHMLMHIGVSAEKPYSCQECKKQFESKWKLKGHILHHSGDMPHKCNLCQKAFRLKYDLKSHTIKVHTKLNKCETGDKYFNCSKSLNIHLLCKGNFNIAVNSSSVKQQKVLKNLNIQPVRKEEVVKKESIPEEGELGPFLEEGEVLN